MLEVTPSSPLYHAAVILLALQNDAVEVLRHFTPDELARVAEVMSYVEKMPPERDAVERIISAFTSQLREPQGLSLHPDEFRSTILVQAIGEERAHSLMDRAEMNRNAVGMEPIKHMEARDIAEMFREEHPQVMSILMAHLDPDKAAATLKHFPQDVRSEVMLRVATMESIPPHALAELNEVMSRQFDGTETLKSSTVGGVKVAASILNLMDSGQDDVILTHIGTHGSEKLSTEIRELMFIFENLLDLDDRTIQAILREVPTEKLGIALRGAQEPIKQHILRNMSERAATILVEDMDARGPVRLSEVEQAQKEILARVRAMADDGRIQLSVRQEALV